ncbi:zinc finger, CCHC-type containing protein [Tanacetum coccineum]
MEWYRNIRIVLSVEDKLPFLEQPIPALPASKEIAGLMLMTMDPDIQKNLKHLGAYDMLKELKTLYAQQAYQELLQTVREFHACKQEEGQSISSYNYNMHSMGKTVTELHAMLKLHEQTLPPKEVAPALHAIRTGRIQKTKRKKLHKAAKENQGKGKAKMGYAPVPAPPFSPKPKNPPTPKKDNPAKEAICHQCGEGLRESRKLKPGALSLYVGDGHRATVEAIGEFHLCLPSGLVLILHNCHYAPSITRGIISVSRFYKDGFVNRFENDNSISISRNNLIYFNVVPRDDIYKIVLSSSNTNDSSMYAVSNKRAKLNLDSALLWHCRLGHISKKRIKKLQHDRLLNSTDIKSFEKRVPCMSGKMARKPYSHQVEKG